MVHRAEIAYVKGLHQTQIMRKPNVLGVGIGYKTVGRSRTEDLCLVALVSRKIPKAGLQESALVPVEVDGVETDVVEVGDLRAMQDRRGRWRPLKGGISVGHYKVTAGTLGCVVRDKVTDERLILSNNHVLANSNRAKEGDPILQPGAADGGRVDNDVAASLARFVPIQFGEEPPTCGIAIGLASVANAAAALVGSKHRLEAYQLDPQAMNQVDAALARPLEDIQLEEEILDIGVLGGTTPAQLGMGVRKSGRTTGFTTGQITVLDATLKIRYGDRSASFDGQIVTTPMSSPGDSGSVLVSADSLLAVGLLFAGSEQATVFNPMGIVLDALGIVI